MKMTFKQFTCMLIALVIPTLSFAFFCPTNFNQIQIGDSIDTVIKLCGKPNSEKKSSVPNDDVPQQWSYYFPQNYVIGATNDKQGSQPAVITFNASGSVVNISVNNVSVNSTRVCGSGIQLGSTRESVKSACGKPSFINRQTQSTDPTESSSEKIEIIQYVYTTTPPMTLIFQDGKLKEKR